MKGRKRGFIFLLILALCLTNLSLSNNIYSVPVHAASQNDTVILSVERFTLGKGWVTEPAVVPLKSGDTAASVIERYLGNNGYPCEVKQSSFGWYLSAIENADPKDMPLNIPQFIIKMSNGTLTNQLKNDRQPTLSEFSYTSYSGWMCSVNNDFPDVGLASVPVYADDVIRLQFTVYGTGTDITGEDIGTQKVYYKRADKSALLTRVAYIHQNPSAWLTTDTDSKAYEQALTVCKDLEATQTQVDNALASLPQVQTIWPESIAISSSSLQLYDNDTAVKLSAKVSPSNTTFPSASWKSSNTDIVTVDRFGNVTPVGVGEADIVASTANEITASCHVKVISRPVTAIALNMTALSLEAERTWQLEVTHQPVNATENYNLQWSSSDESVAVVDENGLVTAVESGKTEICVVKKGSDISAVCQVSVGNAKELALACAEQIRALPSAGVLTLEDKEKVKTAQNAYESLSETAKEYLGDERKTLENKLSRCVSTMDELIAQNERLTNVRSLLTAIPEYADITLKDVNAIQAAKDAYDALSVTEQMMISSTDRVKLNRAVSKCETLLVNVEEVNQLLLALPKDMTLDDWKKIQTAYSAYQALTDEEQACLNSEAYNQLEQAINLCTEELTQAVNSLQGTGSCDVKSRTVQAFVKADLLYQLMKADIVAEQNIISRISSIENWIGTAIHSANSVTVQEAWYVQLYAAKASSSSSDLQSVQAVNKKVTKIVSAWDISYTDVRTGEAYSPSEKVTLSIANVKLSELKNPALYVKTSSGVKKAEAQFNTEEGTIVVQTKYTGRFFLAEVPIPLQGISLTSKVNVLKGQTLKLSPVLKPANCTESPSYVWSSSNKKIASVNSNGVVTGKKAGTATIQAVVKGNSSFKASCKVTVITQANALSVSVSDIMKQTKAYILSVDTDPTIGSEWNVLGLARSGMDLNNEYFKTYYNHFANYLKENKGVLTNSARYSEYSKAILTMTAIGKDARNIAGYNLFEKLADMDNVVKQGNNGPIWALIAVNSNPSYTFPKVKGVKNSTTKKKLIQYLLDVECDKGGWALSGNVADSDMTGMALQALAPYYQKKGYEKVTAAIDRALQVLSDMQLQSGGFGTMGAETSESNAQVITALTALGIDPQTDYRFVKNGYWTIENLLTYHIDGSGFMHVKSGANNNGGTSGVVDGIATEQGYYALTAYQRLIEGKTSLYDMSDLQVKEGKNGDGKGTGIQNSNPSESKFPSGSNSIKDKTDKSGNTDKTNSGSGKSNTSGQSASNPTASNRTSSVGKTASAATQAGQNTASKNNMNSTNNASGKSSDTKTQSADKSTTNSGMWTFQGEDYVSDQAGADLEVSTMTSASKDDTQLMIMDILLGICIAMNFVLFSLFIREKKRQKKILTKEE